MTQHSVRVLSDVVDNELPRSSATSTRGGWAELELTHRESSMLAEAATRVSAHPAKDPLAFRHEAVAAWQRLDTPTKDRMCQLADGVSRRPELHVLNLPLMHDLPPTPVVGQFCELSVATSEFLMLACSAPFGLPISYRDQREGRLYHDIYPIARSATAVSSQSSKARLGFHTEMFFHPAPPDFLFLHCLRPDPAGQAETGVASLEDITSRLSVGDIRTLRQAKFALDLSRLHGSYVLAGRAITDQDPRPVIPVIGDSTDNGRFRFEPELTTPVTDIAATSMHNADAAAEESIATGRLLAGSMLLLDNRRAVHSRSPFVANFDGNDRWLRRMMVGRRGSGGPSDYIVRHDLDLSRAWSAKGASVRSVAYRTAERSA